MRTIEVPLQDCFPFYSRWEDQPSYPAGDCTLSPPITASFFLFALYAPSMLRAGLAGQVGFSDCQGVEVMASANVSIIWSLAPPHLAFVQGSRLEAGGRLALPVPLPICPLVQDLRGSIFPRQG